jgi:Amt family ammonium transporter
MLFAAPAAAQPLDGGATAWMLSATALVFLATLPGLALYYAGLLRARNVLSILMQCFAAAALVSIAWWTYGYSLIFDRSGMSSGAAGVAAFIGTLNRALGQGLDAAAVVGPVPESVFMAHALGAAIIGVVVTLAGGAERLRFTAALWIGLMWFTFVYIPIGHALWSGPGAYFVESGVTDAAGALPVQISAGISGLVLALALGRRRDYPQRQLPPHNLTMTVLGAGLVWIGWFGLTAGHSTGANGATGMALLVTQLSASVAALTWMAADFSVHRKASVLGGVTGAMAGLAASLPAAAVAGPKGAIAIGMAGAVASWIAVSPIKRRFGYDDSLDVFGVHAVGAAIGLVLTPLAAQARWGGMGLADTVTVAEQMGIQARALAVVALYAIAATWVVVRTVDLAMGLRIGAEDEDQGMDVTAQGERGYNL